MARRRSTTWRWHIGKPYFAAIHPFRWRGALRWAWYILALIWLAALFKEMAPENRRAAQIAALLMLCLLARHDLRLDHWPSQWFKHYHRKVL